jgi:hypothetical protein
LSTPAHSLLSTIPLSMFFVTVDRLMAISLLTGYDSTKRRRLFALYTLLLTVFTTTALISFCQALPLPEYTQCWTHGCVEGGSLDLYLYWRVFCALVNCLLGLVFFRRLHLAHQVVVMSAYGSADESRNKAVGARGLEEVKCVNE